MTSITAIPRTSIGAPPAGAAPATDTAPSQPTEFDPGVGDWLQTAFGTVFFGAAGAAVGAIALGIAGARPGGGVLAWGKIGMIGGALIGAPAGGFGMYNILKSDHEQAELERLGVQQ